MELAKLIFEFGLTDRITTHPDGVTPESDTDHTVMLGIMACAYAERFAPHLNRGKIAQYALLHDFVEVYAKDTATFGVQSEEAARIKEEKETAALKRIKDEYDAVFPWIGNTIESYEHLDSPEARFVKVFDKVLPKIAHILDKGVIITALGHTRESVQEHHGHQLEKLGRTYGSDQPEAMAILEGMMERSDAFISQMDQ